MDPLLSDSPNSGAGVFSEIAFYVRVGRGTAFDGEIATIRAALSQLQCHLEKFTRSVILCGRYRAERSLCPARSRLWATVKALEDYSFQGARVSDDQRADPSFKYC
ncbi:hypothetical protein CEXT_641961 [Caerostris extrusa]|uniref:Uncharacterized protein n=1 Tax=Caerostris extrusa TaxID=172846 RepID=A0AAV4Q5M7_CAEEX|nr:hypothetical protein CEXT_641961 [Caerostris extrusa]